MKILLVDDTPANIDVLRKTLEPEGYNLSFAPNGKIALKLAVHNQPDLILLDVMMPEMDGFEACRELKKDEKTRNIPVVFITAKTETEDIVNGFNLGGVDYIAKPFRQEEVCARVKTHLQLMYAQRQLEKKNKALVELNELKNQFLGMAAHDLRNPLSSICGFSRMIKEEKGNLPGNQMDEFLDIIYSSGHKMLAMVTNFLDISVIESGQLKLDIRPHSLKKLVEERVRIFSFQTQRKQIALHESLAEIPDLPFDYNHVSQVIDNLVGNAIKFSPKNSRINVSMKEDGGKVKFSVKDEGPGISKEDQSKLCGAFQKLGAKATGGEKSTGLGLAIVKKIIEAHGSTLEVESEVGSGAIFSFSLPRKS
jgi:signal transduction histidine kinase